MCNSNNSLLTSHRWPYASIRIFSLINRSGIRLYLNEFVATKTNYECWGRVFILILVGSLQSILDVCLAPCRLVTRISRLFVLLSVWYYWYDLACCWTWKIISLATWMVRGVRCDSSGVWIVLTYSSQFGLSDNSALSWWCEWQVTSLCHNLSLELLVSAVRVGYVRIGMFWRISRPYWMSHLWQIWLLECEDVMLMTRGLLDSHLAEVNYCLTWLRRG